MKPRITFCITCKGRAQHIKLTLPQNLRDNASYPNARFLLLNYSSPDDLMEYLAWNHREAIQDHILSVYTYQTDGPFRMAHAKNMAHRLAISEGADILVNLDADNFTGAGFARYIAEAFKEPNVFMAIGKIVPGITPRGLSGRIVVSKQAFIRAGGYDERFADWSPDDKDFNHRLQRMGYEWRKIEDRFLDCVRHNDKMRFREYPHAKHQGHSDAAILAECTNRVVNYGDFGCGQVTRYGGYSGRTEEGERYIIGRVPTRIFGIGMHKTGTTSLHHALKILGLDSAHWPSAGWAKKIWREMNTEGRSVTLERHHAVCDLPISNLYRKLDAAYPGSKFILTTRNEQAWLESVRRHWSPETNPYRHQWDTDPFTHIIHNAIYGRTSFHPATFLKAFRRHNARVLEFFKDRPEDLLILDVDQPQSWELLCNFLNEPMPVVAYPHANRGQA